MPNEVMQGVDIATKAYNQFNARTAVLLHENTNAGIGNAKVFAETFTKLGGKILAESVLAATSMTLPRLRPALRVLGRSM